MIPNIQDIKVVAKRRNGCHFVVKLDIVLLSVILGETRLSELGGWIFVMWNLEGMDRYG